MPEPKEKSPSESSPYSKEDVLKFFDRYRARPDTPKYTYEEQNQIAEAMNAASKRFNEEKTPEAEREMTELTKKFTEGKADKNHVSTLWPPLQAAKTFLEDPEMAAKIPESNSLIAKVNNLFKKLEEAQKTEHMSDELVKDALSFMDEMEAQLK